MNGYISALTIYYKHADNQGKCDMRFKDTVGISYHLRKCELILRQKMDKALSSLNLTVPKYSVLAILEEQERMTNAELARAAFVTPQTMNRLLHSMEEEGLVRSQSDKKNELKIFYILTKKAHKVVCDAHSEVNKLEKKMIEHFKNDDQHSYKKFEAQLQKMLESLNS